LANHIFGNGIGLDDGQGAFNRHDISQVKTSQNGLKGELF
jgi:hypothetical protein